MRVAIAGAHGKIGQRLTRQLAARGDTVVGLIRNPDHSGDIRRQGGEPAVCDLEAESARTIASAIEGSGAVVFAAGAGAGSGAERKWAMDRDGAIKLLEAAVQAGVARYLSISAVGADDPPEGDDVFSVYLRAKAQADDAVRGSDREWTIIRPGRLTDEPGTGRLRIDSESFRGEVPRDDVAALLVAVLDEPRSARRILYVNGGDQPLAQALAAVLDQG